MAKKTEYGSVKRLGARYGRTVRYKLGKIEAEQKKRHVSPFTNKKTVRRLASGIWYCTKTGRKFASKAYTVALDAFKERHAEEAAGKKK